MRSVKKIKGVLKYLKREGTSTNGNPRHSVSIKGGVYKTEVDSPLGYTIPELDGKKVEATVGEHYRTWVIANVKEI